MGSGLTPARPAPTPAVGRRRSASDPDSLTRRASLTALAQWLDYGSRVAVGVAVTPVVLRALGASQFGTWEVLLRLVSYAAVADGRPMDALRLIVAREQGRGRPDAQAEAVRHAIATWLLFLPVVIVAGVAVVWGAPAVTRTAAGDAVVVRACAALLVVNLAMAMLATLFEAVLSGANQGYRRMGLAAAMHVVAGVLMVSSTRAGFGLAGLAGVQVLVTLLTASLYLRVVRRHVPWFRMAGPQFSGVWTFARFSGWSMAGDAVAKVLLASDVILLGWLASTSMVTSYVLTGYAAQAAAGILTLGVMAAVPGLADVLGRPGDRRGPELRAELLALAWCAATVSGALVLLWNRAFLRLWVGPTPFAGPVVNVLIVLMLVQTVLIRCETAVLNAMLQVRPRVLVSLAALGIAGPVAFVLVPTWGLIGVCVAMIAGRLVQTVGLPIAVNVAAGRSACEGARGVLRPAAATAAIVGVCVALQPRLTSGSWTGLALGVLTSGLILLPLTALCGLSRGQRGALRGRVSAGLT